ncbi:unnamed protein product [Miscanthus lutarioriparius]|uniref:Uncharacterized protein n=1 Tax=Miscanthus lutarioriparius TaxID=422564 RepID=A0A811NLK4_9POAL|nr:unnamed protein product [Miscanthus lutarioriparius]
MMHFQQALALAVCIFRQVKARPPVLHAHLAGQQPVVGMEQQQAVEVVEDVEPWPSCDGASGNYAAGSAYGNNTQQLILDLQTNASASPANFASGFVGAGAGTAVVYGLMICRGDVSTSDCFDCGTRAWQDVQPLCNRTRDAALVYNQCYVRVAGTNFLASPNNTGMVRVVGGATIAGGVDVAAYDAARSGGCSTPPRSTRWTAARPVVVVAESLLRGGAARGARPAGPQHLVPGAVRGGPDAGAVPEVPGRPDGTVVEREGSSPTGQARGKNNSEGKLFGIILPIVFVVVVTAIALYVCKKRRSRGIKLPHGTHTVEDFGSIKSTLLSLSSLQVATNNFDESNKLGEGGFGVVYKGDLSGQEVAVKRMSKGSGQGLEELKNELVLVAKLHHKNLVRVEGFCLEEGERLLVYEYMPNKSLDTIIFDPEEKMQLDWRKRFNIIEGVARGLQYLHEESQKKIIHRDMKASNVLLDADMNPKIGDFGLARLFEQDQTRDLTKHIVGTFGYMSPEYVMRGQFSTKSDVFSFGILVIEIVTGWRNTGHYFYDEQNEDIISLQSPMDRPTMSDVMVMLSGDDTSSLPPAARPTFFLDRSTVYSYNSCTITHLSAR